MSYGLKLDRESVKKIKIGVLLKNNRLKEKKILNMLSKPKTLPTIVDPKLPDYISK